MATIAKMVIAGIVDPTGVKQGLAESLSQLQRFRRLASKRIDMELAYPDLKKAEAAQKLLAGIQKSFNAVMADAKFDLGTEKIDTKQFKALGLQAKKDFNKGLEATIARLDSKQLLTPEIYQNLVNQFKSLGDASGKAMGKAAQRGLAAHPLLGNLTTTGQRAANTLLNGLNQAYSARVSDLREQFANKLITVQQFRRKGQQAADEFDKGITAGLAALRSKNQATEAITAALVDSYKLAGTKAANQFMFSLDKQMGENITRIGMTLSAAVTLPVVAASTAAVKLGADFELAMNRIRGILQPTEADMAKLAAQARKIGAETQFSSRDAANAQAVLAQQTQSVAKTLAAMPSITNLAAAGLTDMTSATMIATGIMFGFGQSIDQVQASTDVLARLANIARTDIHELSEAFKFVGPDAVRAGQSFETIAAALGAMSQRNIRASMGGTALRGIMQSLVNPTRKAGIALKALGIDVFDASGKMKDLITLVEEFEDAQRRASSNEGFQKRLNDIFKTRAGTGFSTLLQVGSEGLRAMEKQLDAAGGTAKRVADVQMSGAIGAFRELQSAVEELALAFADSGLLAGVTKFARMLADIVRMMKDTNPGLLKFLTYAGLITAAFGPMLIAIGKAITLFATLRAILISVNGAAALAGIGASLATGGAVIVGLGILAAILLKVAGNAARARAEMNQFKDSLVGQGLDQLRQMQSTLEASIKFHQAMGKALQERMKTDAKFSLAETAKGPNSALNKVIKLVAKQLAQLEEVRHAIKEAEQQAADIAAAGTVKIDVPTGPTLDLDFEDSDVVKVKSAFEKLSEEIKLAINFTSALENKISEQPKVVDALSRAWAAVNFWILQSGTDLTETTAELLEMRNRLQEVFQKVDVILPKMTEDEFRRAIGADKPLRLQIVPIIDVTMVHARSPLEKAVEEFEKAANNALSTKLDLDLLGKTKNIAGVKVAASAYADALSKAKVAESALSKIILASNLPLKEKEELIKKIQEAMDKLEKTEKKSAKNLQRMSTSFQGIADSVRGILAIAEAFGQVDERAANVLNTVADLASSLSNFTQSLATGDAFGAIASAIGSVGQLIKLGQSLFGKSEGDKRREEIYRSNTAALAELKRSIDAWSVNVNTIGRSQPVINATIENIRKAMDLLFQKAGKTIDFGKFQFKSIEEFDKQLKLAGSSFAEVRAIAEELNIDLFNEKGRLSAAGLEALTKAMDLQRIKLTQFGKSFDDVRNKLELKRNIFNLDVSPVADLQMSLDLLKQFAPGIANLFTGLDASTESGRAAIEAALQQLFKMLEQKLIDPSMFKDITFEQLTGLMGGMADALDTFREKTEEATKDIVNVPSGFKIARYQFQHMMTQAAVATKNFAQRVDTVTPTDASPIQKLMAAFTELTPKVAEAQLPDLTPLTQLMDNMGTVASEDLAKFQEALNKITADAPTWGELPSIQPIQDTVARIADSGQGVSAELAAFAERLRNVQVPTLTIAPTDMTPLSDMVTDVARANAAVSAELNALALGIQATRAEIAGTPLVGVPTDFTPLADVVTAIATANTAVATELTALALDIQTTRTNLIAQPLIVTPPDMTPLTLMLSAFSVAGLTATTDLNTFSAALRNATAATESLATGGATALLSPVATARVRETLPTAPEPVRQGGAMNLTIYANVQQTADPEEWYEGVKKVTKNKVKAKYGADASSRVEERMP